MVYVGLSYYGPALGNEEHLSFFFSSLAEIPSYMACWVVMDRWGRRWPLCLCMVVAGISCITTVLLSPGIESFREKQGNERSPHRINSDDSDEQTNRESPLFLIVLLLLLLFYRCGCDHANSIPLIEIRDIGLLSNYISVRRWTLPHAIARRSDRFLCLHQRSRINNHSLCYVSRKWS